MCTEMQKGGCQDSASVRRMLSLTVKLTGNEPDVNWCVLCKSRDSTGYWLCLILFFVVFFLTKHG
jgi:hypothetical protein